MLKSPYCCHLPQSFGEPEATTHVVTQTTGRSRQLVSKGKKADRVYLGQLRGSLKVCSSINTPQNTDNTHIPKTLAETNTSGATCYLKPFLMY